MADKANTTDSEEWVIYGLSRSDGPIRYVGKAKDARTRLLQHKSKARCGHKSPLCDWIRKVTADGGDIVITLLENGSGATWEEAERTWIAQFDPTTLFNRARGGMDIGPIPPEARRRAGDKLKTRTFSEAHRQRISESKKGCKRPDVTDRQQGKPNPRKGERLNISDSERERRSASAKEMARHLTRWTDLSIEQKAERSAKIAASVAKSWAQMTPEQRMKRCGPIVESRKERLNSAS